MALTIWISSRNLRFFSVNDKYPSRFFQVSESDGENHQSRHGNNQEVWNADTHDLLIFLIYFL